ncbi:MAG TPA: hypothetical protein VD833_10625 [Vicinamibacterales bacterium]|nr:hypothetical protein [Vicinamibacterales bacterium]
MRTSGGRGAEGWIMAFPVVALIVAASLRGDGFGMMLVGLERTIRELSTAVLNFLGGLL